MVGISDREGFIVVHPNGVSESWNGELCCIPSSVLGTDDVGFTRAILDRVESELCVDRRRVYATGMSAGGFMSHRLGCELSHRITAIAPVAGLNGVSDCTPGRAVPVFQFHGTADRVISWDYFFGASVPDTIDGWVTRNGCNAESTVFFDEGDVTCEEWAGCTDGAIVRLCGVDGGGHQWPGSSHAVPFLGHRTDVISASQMMWDFFEGFSLP